MSSARSIDQAIPQHTYTSAFVATSSSMRSSAYQCLLQSDVVLMLGVGAFEFDELLDGLDSKYGGNSPSRLESRLISLHPFVDSRASVQQYQYEVGTELGVITLLLNCLACAKKACEPQLPSTIEYFIDSLDIGHIASESALTEEELEHITQILLQARTPMIVVGESFSQHTHTHLIRDIIAMIQAYTIEFSAIAYLRNCYVLESFEPDHFEVCGLDSSAAQILHHLNKLPESNGAFVYLSLSNGQNVQDPVLCATPAFLRLMRLEDTERVSLCIDTLVIECEIRQVGYLQGASAVLNGWYRESMYPFIKAQFVRNGSRNG